IGNTYQVRYVLSANNSTTVSMQVSAAGVTQSESVTVSGAHSLANPEWQERFFTFTATSTSTNLQFQNLPGSGTGVFLADVSVTDLSAANGNDTLIGHGGNDALIGSGGSDRLEGDDANLVYNGSFELGPFGTGTVPTGWSRPTVTTEGVVDFHSSRATQGTSFYAFGGWTSAQGTSLAQTINTVAGTQYTLSFDMTRLMTPADQSAGQLQVEVLDGSNTLVNQTAIINSGARQTYTYTFTATSDATTLRFADTSLFPAANDLDLDNVRVYAASGGNDTLFGGAGIDQLYSGGGNDTLGGGAGADYIDGGVGTDTVSYAASSTGETINLNNNRQASAGEANGDWLANIENVIGSAFADTLTGNSGNNVLDGGAGNTFTGSDSNDSYAGNTGNDSI
ncbi:MAG: DUF642 domain-containing protein, partial [bacterium]